MLLQILPQRLAENAHAAAVDDADSRMPARNARSTNFSTSRGFVNGRPMTLISVGA